MNEIRSPWIHHTLHKSRADLVLDTAVKNGHTSTVDALWAGLLPILYKDCSLCSLIDLYAWLFATVV
jgi:hypothetical protein